jgi:hypothetical protein
MSSEYAQRNGERQQQQGDKPDLEGQYHAIGIPAVNAAASMARRKRDEQARQQQQAMVFDYED